MTVVPEMPSPYNSENNPLDYEKQAQFDALLRNTAESLELMTTPDSITYTTTGATFGKFSDCELNISHTITGDAHSGTVSFLHSEDRDQSFFLSHGNHANAAWKTTNAPTKLWSSGKLIQRIHQNWPLSDYDAADLPRLVALYSDTETPIEAKTVFDTLEHYTLRNETGVTSYSAQWSEYESSDTIDDDMTLAEFTIQHEGTPLQDDLRHIAVRFIIPTYTNGVTIPVECTVSSDELGIVDISATYPDPYTDATRIMQIPDYDRFYEVFRQVLERFAADKNA